jgi:4-diphosphocytidyl-2-C-methyl-D-erythritol kinase
MRVKSFAKINLGIEVLKKREDGYHEIRTLFQTVGLYDLLEIFPLAGNEIILKGNDPSISWDESNLIHRAGMLLKERFSCERGVEIHVTKNIPAGKGLGGGSSNAAMTLWVLNEMWGLCLKKEELQGLGSLLGADVSFFFEGGLCLGRGIGSRIFPLDDLDPCLCVLVLPSVSLATASVYGTHRVSLTSQKKDSKIIKFLDSRDLGFLENDLEKTVFRSYPQIKAIKKLLQKQGSELSLMSGSGSAVFGLFRQKEQAEKAARAISEEHPVVFVATIPREAYWAEINTGV